MRPRWIKGSGIGLIGQHAFPGLKEKARELRRQMTPAERMLWARVRRGGVAGLHFRRQQPVDCSIVDFLCDSVKLVVELDGSAHAGRGDYDRERDARLKALGLRVLRFSNEAVMTDVEAVVDAILASFLEDTTVSLPSPFGDGLGGGAATREAGGGAFD